MAVVVLIELAAQPSRLDPDDGVDARIVLLAAFENLRADDVFLEAIALTGKRPLDDVPKKPTQTIGIHERIAAEDSVELAANFIASRVHGVSIGASV
jgi:hypothetical protein